MTKSPFRLYRVSYNLFPEYGVWKKMRQRCNDPNNKDYHLYGGKGIVVCERWNEFGTFLLDMGQRPSFKHSIDRIDSNGNYCPENCRWATPLEQFGNTSRIVRFTHNGKTLSIPEWSRELGINLLTMRRRQSRGYSIEKILYAGSFRGKK